MKWIKIICLSLCLPWFGTTMHAHQLERKMGLDDVRAIIEQNNAVIIATIQQTIADENIKQSQSNYLPELAINGNAYLLNNKPLSNASQTNSFQYHCNINSEIDIYTGGLHTYTTKLMRNEKTMSEVNLKEIKQEITLEAFIILYDIYRNTKYKEFILSSIHLRQMEYNRIEQLYQNGLVLKSDLLRSKLYITDLQKDEIAINNSIIILSDKLCTLLHLDNHCFITPTLDSNLQYAIDNDFDNLFNYALHNSPILQKQQIRQNHEILNLKKMYAGLKPNIKLYAQYGIGTALPDYNYNHQLGGEFGAKLNFSISSFYKIKHSLKAQQQQIQQEETELNQQENQLHNTLFLTYTRYQESLINIQRAKEKIELSKESARILHNSYFNQQALLIDVLESETKSMEASFEWIEAVVDSQKYYWTLKQISGLLITE